MASPGRRLSHHRQNSSVTPTTARRDDPYGAAARLGWRPPRVWSSSFFSSSTPPLRSSDISPGGRTTENGFGRNWTRRHGLDNFTNWALICGFFFPNLTIHYLSYSMRFSLFKTPNRHWFDGVEILSTTLGHIRRNYYKMVEALPRFLFPEFHPIPPTFICWPLSLFNFLTFPTLYASFTLFILHIFPKVIKYFTQHSRGCWRYPHEEAVMVELEGTR